MRLALDHLTVADTTPSQLVAVAAAIGCPAICLFMEPMAVLPRLPRFELYGDTPERRETLARMADGGVSLDIAYPFTLTGRSDIASFARALETAAVLGAWGVNVLAYDREPARRADSFATFCDLAGGFGLNVVVEFYPLSQVRTLDDAVALVRGVGAPGRVGVNADLLHLTRSGGTIESLTAVPPEWILYAQYCDAPAVQDRLSWDYEASHQRLAAGAGALNLAGFAAAMPPGCRASVEMPREDALQAGVPTYDRARAALDGVRQAVGGRI